MDGTKFGGGEGEQMNIGSYTINPGHVCYWGLMILLISNPVEHGQIALNIFLILVSSAIQLLGLA